MFLTFSGVCDKITALFTSFENNSVRKLTINSNFFHKYSMICTDYLYICDIYINVLTMNWTQLLSGKRFGMEEYHERKHERTDFQHIVWKYHA